MRLIEIHSESVRTGIGHSSKGNQLKWYQDDWWYKADAFGFEGLAEAVTSALLEHSSIRDFVRYEPVMIRYKDKAYRGCRCRNFRKESEELVPLERLSRIYTGFSLARELARISDVKQRILYTEELVRNVTGIGDFGAYLTAMLEMDAFFLNEDRHTNNIAVLYDAGTKSYHLCPYYDMGLAFFSDTREDYPVGLTYAQCREKIEAKPFSADFDEQMDAAEELYGVQFQFCIPGNEIMDVLQRHQRDWDHGEPIYSADEYRRVEEVLRYQAGKYQYFFRNYR
ncbi:MAG: hypothetical protein LUG99_01430 [Lachnospiraceae bacterium]|nr:hypothetical protein [Lachnospiraceae bacterium]